MRHASWACCAIEGLRRGALRAALALGVLLLAGPQATHGAGADTPERWRAPEVDYAEERIADAAPPSLTSHELPADGWRRVPLPLHRAGLRGDTAAHHVVVWLRWRSPAGVTAADQPAVLYMPRCHGCRMAALYMDGALVHAVAYPQGTLHFNDPLWMPLPLGALATSPRELRLRIVLGASDNLILSTLWLGSTAELGTDRATRRLLQSQLPAAASAAFALVGVFALFVWSRRRRESAYLLFFALSLLYWVRCLHFYVPYSPVPAVRWLISQGTVNSLGWMMLVAYLFALRVQGLRYARAERVLVGVMSAATLVSLLVPADSRDMMGSARSLIYPAYLAVAMGVTAHASMSAWHRRSAEGAWVAASLWVNIVLGAHDLLLQRGQADLEGSFLLPVGGVVMFCAFGAVVLRRFVGALRSSEWTSERLALRLAQRESELEASFQQLREVQRQQVLEAERQRLMREMHDGLGATLMSSLAAVERGRMDQASMAEMLRESVDELKIAIDSLDPAGHDVPVLLGMLRYRLGPRLQAAGLTLHWQVSDLPPLPWLAAADALHVLRIVQEVLTNVIKHAGATAVTVRTASEPDAVLLQVSDDGRGLPPDGQGRGRGLQNMRYRASALGAGLHIDGSAGRGTCVSLRLPRVKPAP